MTNEIRLWQLEKNATFGVHTGTLQVSQSLVTLIKPC